MSRRAKSANEGGGKKGKQRSEGPSPGAGREADAPLEPLTQDHPLATALVVVAFVTVALVAVWFKMDVNRVFDVPKALALKVGGGGAFLVWLLYGLFGRGYDLRSFRLFSGPVFALAGVVVISTYLSLDVPTSLYGVYERQFGLQGFLACVGLYAVTSSSLGGKRGAVMGLGWLALLGGVVGSYALLQAQGWDPYPFFFQKPHTKVYSFLGNATFAGNALALIFPISTLLAIVTSAGALSRERWEEDGAFTGWLMWAVGFVGLLLLLLFPGWAMSTVDDGEKREGFYKLGVGLGMLGTMAAAGLGSYGPFKLATRSARSMADAVAAGAMAASAVGIVIGLFFTRTRGAWVGSAVAIAVGFLLLPLLFRDSPHFSRIRNACWGSALALALLFAGFVAKAESVCADKNGRCMLVARTIRSIPAAFDPNRHDYGKGQGTRKYLWSESPKVLLDHANTLKRLYEDRAIYAEEVKKGAVRELDPEDWGPYKPEDVKLDTGWRSAEVWLFGIGIETYRYAFMSHKSKRLEALDPMTNHDNPHNNYLYILASFGVLGLAAYLWLLWRLLSQSFKRFIDPERGSRSERALAFGVVTSFFSYAVYSIAGFDSVACSVFLFFLLGCAAAYFEPAQGEPPTPLLVGLRQQWAARRGGDPSAVGSAPLWITALVAVLGVLLLGDAVVGGIRVYRAERAFVGEEPIRTRDPVAYHQQKAANILTAIKRLPHESFYRQNLGSEYLELVKVERRRAQGLARAGKNAEAKAAADTAQSYAKQAEVALYSALAHSWAPENIYISLFQVYYHLGDYPAARLALSRALEHSPHLGAVRANLAALELQANLPEDALANSLWVLEVDPRSNTALRTAIQAYAAQGNFTKARALLRTAKQRLPKDKTFGQVEAELDQQERAATSTSG
ncbi:MAG: O-antigen ligase family protein [Deltaproteobacteria bacterium]|nr:O-antigen ligase family protein [Deltaproteobacteria bacterium]